MAKTLLLADDSVTIQKVVGISFASEDVDLVTVDNGDDAVRRAKEIRPDAILADVVMPGMNGYEVCEAVKADPALSHVPVLLLTGTFEAFDEERAQRCGAAGHVAKPFEAQVLVERVRELFARSAAAAQPPAAPAAAGPPSPAEALTQNPAAAPPEPAPPPPPPAPAADESFDLFDEQVAAPVATPPPPPAAPPPAPSPAASPPEALTPPPAVPRDDSVALSSSDATFAFGDEEFDAPAAAPEPAPPDPMAGAPPDRTIAIMPEDPADAGDPLPPVPPPVSLGDSFAAGADAEDDLLTADLGAPDPTPAVGDDAFDFELSDPGPTANPGETELVSPGDLASATVLDPKGASSFDVSYSDLGEPLSDEPAAAAGSVAPPEPTIPSLEPARPAMPATPRPAVEPAPAAPPVEPTPAVQPLASLEPPMPPFAEPATPEPAASWAEEPSAPRPPAMPPTPPTEPPTPAVAEAEPVAPVLESPLEPPTAAPREEPELPSGSPEDSFSRGSAQAVDAPAGTHDPSALAGMALAEITPRLRQELHDTLEKIAWESFGNLTEQIVRQVMERAERVAWEVIPQMAETLIREEIRRMKGEPEGE